MWGLSIKTKERLKEKNGRGLSFELGRFLCTLV